MTDTATALKPSIDLQLLLNAIPGCFIVLTPDKYIRHTSLSFSEFIGARPESLAGQSVLSAFPQASFNGTHHLSQALEQVYATKQPCDLTGQKYVRRQANGSLEERYWDGEATPIQAENGELAGILLQLKDVTTPEQNQAPEQRNQELLQAIHQNLNDVVWDWDLLTDNIWWSNGLQTNFGHTPGETERTANCWYARIHPDDAARVISSIHQVIDSDLTLWSDVYRFEKKNHEYAEVLTRGSVFRNPAGKAYRMIGTMVDITLYQKPAGEFIAAELVAV